MFQLVRDFCEGLILREVSGQDMDRHGLDGRLLSLRVALVQWAFLYRNLFTVGRAEPSERWRVLLWRSACSAGNILHQAGPSQPLPNPVTCIVQIARPVCLGLCKLYQEEELGFLFLIRLEEASAPHPPAIDFMLFHL